MDHEPSANAIEVRGLTKRFGKRTALDGVDLTVPRGTAFGLLGPNGAGKTTLIRVLLGLTRADSGAFNLLGYELPNDRRAALAQVGAMVEEPRFHSHLTGRENLRVVAAARGMHDAAAIEGALARVGMAERADERVKNYSLGMRQRLGVARALMHSPQLLILDEPANGLDPAGIHEFRAMIGALRDGGLTVFISSHQLDEVERTCDHVAIVDKGRLVSVQQIAGQVDVAGGILVGAADIEAARTALQAHSGVESVEPQDGLLRVRLVASGPSAADLNRMLVEQGIAVDHLQVVKQTLEERFLAATSRLGGEGS